ncbi:MAG: hypothetical protein RIQ56_552 [Candidatus Parcubacteria bacterium]|jgi:hypothetical protein
MKALKIIVIVGLVGAGLFFAGPFILGILYMLLCGGVMMLGGAAVWVGDALVYVVTAILAGLAGYVGLVAFRFAKKHMNNPSLLNTEENITKQNAAFIRMSRAEGKTDDQIRAIFLAGGWTKEQTDKTFQQAAM